MVLGNDGQQKNSKAFLRDDEEKKGRRGESERERGRRAWRAREMKREESLKTILEERRLRSERAGMKE